MRKNLLLLAILVPLVSVSGQSSQPAKPPFYADKSDLLYYLDGDKKISVKTLTDWQKRHAHILANMQLVMGPLPADSQKVPFDLKIVSEEKLEKVLRKKVTFAVGKDDRVTAYLL